MIYDERTTFIHISFFLQAIQRKSPPETSAINTSIKFKRFARNVQWSFRSETGQSID